MAEAGSPGGVGGPPVSPRNARQMTSPPLSPSHGSSGPGSPALYASVRRSPDRHRCLSPDLSSIGLLSGTGSHGVSDTPGSTLSSNSSISSSGSRPRDESDENINWKERCHKLEASLKKFNNRVWKIRDMLATKMDELSIKAEEAEHRAEKAEFKVKVLEQQLASMNWKPEQHGSREGHLEMELQKREERISSLQSQLDDLKVQRTQEAKLVDEKSKKVKEWVTKKLKETELENQQFKLENDTLRDQVEILRARLNSLPTSTARELHRMSLKSQEFRDSMGSPPPEIPERPSSSIMESYRIELAREQQGMDTTRQLGAGGGGAMSAAAAGPPRLQPLSRQDRAVKRDLQGRMDSPRRRQNMGMIPDRADPNMVVGASPVHVDLSPDLEEQMGEGAVMAFEPLYQEIDDNHQSKYEPRRVGPPQVRIERKVFPNPALNTTSLISSTGGSSEMLDRTQGPFSPPSSMTSSQESGPSATKQPELPKSPLAMFLQNTPSNSTDASCPYSKPEPSNYHFVSALATMPRRRKDNRMQIQNIKPSSLDRQLPGTKDDTSTIPYEQLHSNHDRFGLVKPPTPPMRRHPSWENRIYAVANMGLRLPEVGTMNRESSFPVTDGMYTDRMYEDLTVPVYTTVKGRAAQIRSTPFTGDSSSDSSDDESSICVVDNGDGDHAVTVAGPSGSKTTSSMSVRKPVTTTSTSSGATKRAVSSHSIGSETSSDYALPPDEVSINTDSSSDNSEPEQKLLKYTTENLKKDSLENSGYLTKLGGKVKSWKRRWFVLKNGKLLYYKSPSDVARKPQGFINLDGRTRVMRTEGTQTFEIITSKKTYYLTTDSKEDMDQWLRVLQNVLKKQAADRVLGQSKAKESMKGWLIKTKHGRSRRCWCVLVGKFFVYYKSLNDKTPLGQIPLRDARIEEVDRSNDTESDSDDTSIPDYTLGIWPKQQAPTYLMLPTKQEKDSWLYHLTFAAGGGIANLGTEYEQLVAKLMEIKGDLTCHFWKHPLLLHTKEPLDKPLTTLPSEDLQNRAINMFKSLHMFTNVAIDSTQLDYHVALAQTITEQCMQQSELQNELYCQLIKQTSRHPAQHKSGMQNFLLCGSHSWFMCDASPTSPTASVDLSDSKFNPVTHVFLQGWQLLSMCISLFLPHQSILWYLRTHLQRNSDSRNEAGKYAIFCQRALERVTQNGAREARPSRMEVLSILLRNPFHHSQPISIPVHFLNGTYQVVSFDGSTTVEEFLQTLNKAINMRDCAQSGFALFTDDPAGQELEHCLKGHIKLCDVISKWEQAFFHHHSKRGRPDTNRTVKLTYKNRLYFKSLSKTEVDKERLLLAYQTNEEIVNGRFPLSRDLAIELAALMAQIEYGDYRSMSESIISSVGGGRLTPPHPAQQLPVIVERFYPKRYKDGDAIDNRVLERKIQDKWSALRGRSVQDCVRVYLTVAREWPFFGAKLFSARVRGNDICQVWLAIQEDSISILEYATLKLIATHHYKDVVTFGGCRDDLMLVTSSRQETEQGNVTRTERHLFLMTKPKVLEVTVLMASYINCKANRKNLLIARSTSPRPNGPHHAPASSF